MKLIVLFGKPGAGKGTWTGKFLKGREEEWEAVSTGDMIRKAIKSGGDLGKNVKRFSEKGELVPDSIIIQIIKEALVSSKASNIILDGFPRNVSQAKSMLEMGIIPHKVVCIDASDEEIVKRLSERIVCEKCGETYSLGAFKPPKQEGVCDECHGNLIRRKDDEPEVVRNRLKVYQEETAAVVDFMKAKSVDVETVPSCISAEAKQFLFEYIMES